MALPEYLPYAQFLAQIALVCGAFFAGYQFIQGRKERRDESNLQVLSRLTTPEFRAAYAQIWTLPLNAPASVVRDRGPDMEHAVDCVAMTFEVLGVMVHNRMVDIEVVDQAIGGFLRESWRRTRNYIVWKRRDVKSPRLAEWYQWLAEHLAKDNRRLIGAYEAFRHWKR